MVTCRIICSFCVIWQSPGATRQGSKLLFRVNKTSLWILFSFSGHPSKMLARSASTSNLVVEENNRVIYFSSCNIINLNLFQVLLWWYKSKYCLMMLLSDTTKRASLLFINTIKQIQVVLLTRAPQSGSSEADPAYTIHGDRIERARLYIVEELAFNCTKRKNTLAIVMPVCSLSREHKRVSYRIGAPSQFTSCNSWLK